MTATATTTIALDQIQVATPCRADWNEMTGDDRRRFCGECRMNVYNLSGMTREEALALVQNAEGRLCVRFYRRPDGTILTKDCPVGLRALRMKLIKGVSRIAAAITLVCGGLLYGRGVLGDQARNRSVNELPPVSTAGRWLNVAPPEPDPIMGIMIMGDVSASPPPNPNPTK